MRSPSRSTLVSLVVMVGLCTVSPLLAAPPAKSAPPPPPPAAPAAPPPAATPAPAPAPAPTPAPAPAPATPAAPVAATTAPAPIANAAPATEEVVETVALLPINAPEPGLANAATAQAAQGLRDLRVLKVVDPETIAGLLGAEALRQSTGCSDASCLAELAGAVGAAYVVSGSIARTGEEYTLNLVLTDQRTAQAMDGVVRQEKSLKDVGPGMRSAAQQVVRKLLAGKLGTLRLVAAETGADVKLDDVLVGTTPFAPRQLPMGPHKISVEKEGFIAFRQEVVIKPNDMSVVRADLIPSQEFISAYKTRNRVLRGLSGLGGVMTVASLGAGLAAYAAWLAVFINGTADVKNPDGSVKQSGQDVALETLRTPPWEPVQGSTLKNNGLWLVLDGLLVAIFAAPAFALGWAVFAAVFYFVGDDPGRYDRYE
ncbi:MAG: PEGA domain-containing protein [Myxococcota bacterium]